MIKYELLVYNDKSDLCKMVNKYLEQGWKLQGGICIAVISQERYELKYAQALYKEN